MRRGRVRERARGGREREEGDQNWLQSIPKAKLNKQVYQFRHALINVLTEQLL